MAYTSEIEKLERRWNENPLGLTFAPLAEAFRKAGDHTRALELLDLGLAQHPNYVPAHIVRGRCGLDTNNPDAAELAFLRVLELDPENAIALRSFAEICERSGRIPEAMRRLEMLIEVDRSNEDARHQLHRLRSVPASAAAAPAAPAETVNPSIQPPEPPGLIELVSSDEPLEDVQPEPVSAAADDDLGGIAVYEPEEISTGERSEFQLPSDSEALSTSGERLPDVVLGSGMMEQSMPTEYAAGNDGMSPAPSAAAAPMPDAEFAPETEVPEAGSASEGLPLGVEPLPDEVASATSWAGSIFEPRMLEEEPEVTAQASLLEEEVSLAPEHEPAAPVEAALEAEPMQAAAFSAEPLEAPIPQEEWETPEPPPALEPVAQYEPMQEPESDRAPMPVAESPEPTAWAGAEPADEPAASTQEQLDSEAEPAPSEPEPALVVTESMAEVFLRQGHPELALAVYTQLLQRDPENRRVGDAISRLRAELTPPPPAPPAAPRYDANSSGGISIGARLGELLGAARPAVAASVHPPAFEAPRREVEPARPAEDSLSLSSVFGEETGSAPVGPASGPAESPEGEPSFDEFFAPQESAELPSMPSPAQEAAGAPAQSGEDLERFNSWLRGLKG